jgi:hypothetical protein
VSVAVLVACSTGGGDVNDFAGTGGGTSRQSASPDSATSSSSGPGDAPDVDVVVDLDLATRGEPISPLIQGVSGDLSAEEMRDAGITLDSWGGNAASRFNYEHGHAWNAAADWEFRNTSYGWAEDAFRSFADVNADANVDTRVVVPTIGWVARDGDDTNCSFPDDDGGCTGGAGANCEDGGPPTDPTRTSVPSTPERVARWIAALQAKGRELRFIAMDNEPELWGHTHFDIHPECPTFQEIVDTYLEYAKAIRAVAPEAELMGPAMCCWYDYWNIGPDAPDGSGDDFLTWFLRQVHAHDRGTGTQTLDVVDVHFYPQTGVFNDDTDDETNARRLRSTRALWDPTYVDESWIGQPIMFIPRLQAIIDEAYPGLPLAITEWNFGADTTMNGALAIADVLGTYATHGVYAAAYWRTPPSGSPGFHAFKLFGNYDDAGGRFSGDVVAADSSEPAAVRAFAAVDDGTLEVVLVNTSGDDLDVALALGGDAEPPIRRRFRYGPGNLQRIEEVEPGSVSDVVVPASTIELFEIELP